MGAKRLVKGARGEILANTEFPGAFVGIFVTSGIKPSIQFRIRNGFFRLVRHDRCHAISATVAIGTDGLSFTAARAAVRISHERVLDIGAQNGSMSVPAAVLGAKAGCFVYV